MSEQKQIQRNPVASSLAKSAGYDPESQTLAIEFNNGRVGHHFNVPQDEVEALLNADSFGQHYTAHIRPVYDFKWPSSKKDGDDTSEG